MDCRIYSTKEKAYRPLFVQPVGFLANCSGFNPHLLGLLKGLGELDRLGFIFLFQGLALIGGVLECLLYFVHSLLVPAAGSLFGL